MIIFYAIYALLLNTTNYIRSVRFKLTELIRKKIKGVGEGGGFAYFSVRGPFISGTRSMCSPRDPPPTECPGAPLTGPHPPVWEFFPF